MSNYLENYQKWLNSNQLSAEEKEELKAIENDPKEIEFRFTKCIIYKTW